SARFYPRRVLRHLGSPVHQGLCRRVLQQRGRRAENLLQRKTSDRRSEKIGASVAPGNRRHLRRGSCFQIRSIELSIPARDLAFPRRLWLVETVIRAARSQRSRAHRLCCHITDCFSALTAVINLPYFTRYEIHVLLWRSSGGMQ